MDDPYTQALEHLKPMPYPGAPKAPPVAGPPFNLSESPVGLRHRAPLLGEHTTQILDELGYDEAQLMALREDGAI